MAHSGYWFVVRFLLMLLNSSCHQLTNVSNLITILFFLSIWFKINFAKCTRNRQLTYTTFVAPICFVHYFVESSIFSSCACSVCYKPNTDKMFPYYSIVDLTNLSVAKWKWKCIFSNDSFTLTIVQLWKTPLRHIFKGVCN
jgi:hypothetical protein